MVPELSLRLITPRSALWYGAEVDAARAGIAEPFWAFAWPGGQALARYVLDHPDGVRGRRVLAFGAGGGVEAVAAARAGATVSATDIDPLAVAACMENAALNGVTVAAECKDVLGQPCEWDVVLIGDVTYERELSERVCAWSRDLASAGCRVLVADPGRSWWRAGDAFRELARYEAPADDDTDGSALVTTTIWEALRC